VLDAFSRFVVGWSIDSTQTRRWCSTRSDGDRRNGQDDLVIHSDRGVQGGFNWSSQHLDRGGCDGQAGGVDEGVDGPVVDEVAGQAVVAA
jgi:hypothetical protein